MRNAALVSEVLGGAQNTGRKLTCDGDFVSVVRKGLPFRAVVSATRWLGFTEDQACSLLGIPRRTAARRKAKRERLKPVESERLLRLVRVAAAATDVLGDRSAAIRWLQRPNRALGGEIPLGLLDTDVGFQGVMDVLLRVEHGVMS